MSMMILDGYNARIEYDAELDLFRGEILGLTGGADFYGKNTQRKEHQHGRPRGTAAARGRVKLVANPTARTSH